MLNSNEVLAGNFSSSRRYSASHNGIDLRSPTGTPVKSRYAGVVKVCGTNPPGKDFGNYIRVFHPALNQSTWYAHLQSFSCKPGQAVSAGQVIGISNNTGLSTGPHLHFSHSRGETTQWLNPDLQPNQQIGGEEMIADANQATQIYKMLRPNGGPSQGEVDGTAGKRTFAEFLKSAQAEIAQRDAGYRNQDAVVIRLAEEVKTTQAQINSSQNIINTLTTEVGQLQGVISKQGETIAELEHKLSGQPKPPSDKENAVLGFYRAVKEWIKRYIID